MQNSTTSLLRQLKTLTLPGIAMLATGCMGPGMYYGNPYSQPMYAPPQMLNQGTIGPPGSLIIPESSGPAYDPEKTYQNDPGAPADDFDKANGGPFYGTDNEEGVPFPSGGFGEDLGPDVQYNPGSGQGLTRPSSIQPVSATSAPMEYGFDTENYRWLRGVVSFDRQSQVWGVEYSLAARDRFGGRLALVAAQGVLDGLRDGDMVDIHGHVDTDRTDRQGRPFYHVETIQRIQM